MLFFLLMSLNGCLTIDDTLDPDGDDVLWPDDCDNTDSTVFDAERTKSYLDNDGDGYGDRLISIDGCPTVGYVLNDDDCDDNNDQIHPMMPELCDGIDQDCDNKIDDEDIEDLDRESESVGTFYADSDGDGFGDPNHESKRCESSAEWLEDYEDCDDTDANVNPNAIEDCDEKDNDCDDQIDEDTIDKKLRYNDFDRDGFGDPNSPIRVCPGYEEDTTTKLRATDCDDDNEDIHPQADEVCDEIDNNCDGGVDTNPTNGNLYYTDSDMDGFGDADSIVYSCESDPPLRTSDNPDDCDDSDGRTFPDADEICGDAVVNDCDARLAEADAGAANARAACPIETDTLPNAKIQFVGEEGNKVGYSINLRGDYNGDGYSDLLIGTAGPNGGGYVFFGSRTLSGQIRISASDYFLSDSTNSIEFGITVSAVQDMDLDGNSEYLVGYIGSPDDYRGVVHLIMSSSMPTKRAFKREIDLSSRGVRFMGPDWFNTGGSIADAGDVNGDNVPDILVGPGPYAGINRTGIAYLVYGDSRTRGDYILEEDAAATFSNAIDEDTLLGYSLSSAGDLDGDNYGDFLISDPSSSSSSGKVSLSQSGKVYIFKGGQTMSGDVSDADSTLIGVNKNDNAGISVQGGVDVDGDSLGDILVSKSDGVYVVSGYDVISTKKYDLSDSALTIEGPTDWIGYRADFAGDLNGDSFIDLVVIRDDGADFSEATVMYIFLSIGHLSGVIDLDEADTTISDETYLYYLSVAGMGDFDGDGLDDLALGAPYNDSGGSNPGFNSGSVYLISGASLFDY